MLRRAVLTVPILLVAALGLTATPATATTTVPNHMAALGDSITRAFDVNGSYFLKDDPAESWSTGTDPKVASELSHLQALNPGIASDNDAVTGAKMSALAGQMATALGQGADYITVLMGANDVCTKTVSGSTGMTPTATFQSQFSAAMAKVDPNVQVFVSSIPNVNHLYDLFSKNSTAKFIWSLYGVCQDLLSSRATTAYRAAVAKQVQADNTALQTVCAAYANCKWDNLATYKVSFATSDVSTVDYFHPSISGQAKLAYYAWLAGPYV